MTLSGDTGLAPLGFTLVGYQIFQTGCAYFSIGIFFVKQTTKVDLDGFKSCDNLSAFAGFLWGSLSFTSGR